MCVRYAGGRGATDNVTTLLSVGCLLSVVPGLRECKSQCAWANNVNIHVVSDSIECTLSGVCSDAIINCRNSGADDSEFGIYPRFSYGFAWWAVAQKRKTKVSKFNPKRGSEIHSYETRGRYRTGRHRTVAFERLPSQTGAHFVNRLPNSLGKICHNVQVMLV